MTRSRLTALLTAALVLLACLSAGVGAVRAAAAPRAAAAQQPPRAAASRARWSWAPAGLTWSDVSRTATPALWSLLEHGRDRLADGALGAQQHLPRGRLAEPVRRAAGRRPATPASGRPGRRAGPLRAPAGGRRRTGLGRLSPHRGGQGLRRPHRPAGRRADPRRGCVRRSARAALARGDLRRKGHRLRAVRPPARCRRAWRPARRRWWTSARCATRPRWTPATRCRRRPPGRRRSGPSTPASGRCWPPRRGTRDVLVASLSDAGASERLRLAALRGPGVGAGTLESTSTRQAGLVQLSDLTATILDRAGLPDPAAVGGNRCARSPRAAPPRSTGCSSWSTTTRPRTRCTAWSRRSSTAWVLVQLLIYAFVAVVWRRRWGSEAHPVAAAAAGPAGGDHRRRRAGVDVPRQPAAVVARRQPDAGRRRLGRGCS